MGCGNSNLPADLARQGFSVVGMDYSKPLALLLFSQNFSFPFCAEWKRVRSSGPAHFRLFRFGLLGCCSVAAGGITTATRKVIKLQRARFPDMKWIRADLRRMPRFKDKSFDIVIEKALTLVTIHHGNDFW